MRSVPVSIIKHDNGGPPIMLRVGALVVALLLIFGCGGESDWRNIPTPPFRLGDSIGDGPPIAPKVEILQPAHTTRLSLKPRERMSCVVRLTYAGGETLPRFLRAIFRDAKGRDADSYALEPREQSGQCYTLGGWLKAPSRPGRYRLQIDMLPPPDERAAKDQPRSGREGSVGTITAADVEVTRR